MNKSYQELCDEVKLLAHHLSNSTQLNKELGQALDEARELVSKILNLPEGSTAPAPSGQVQRDIELAKSKDRGELEQLYALARMSARLSMRKAEEVEAAFSKADRGPLAAIAEERARQIAVKGWTPEHDDKYRSGELAAAASAYAWAAYYEQDIGDVDRETPPETWPWEDCESWNPSTPRRNLAKAGALIVAELERLDRTEGGGS
ncbi:hypothetical protein L861_09085 [Litchfieldella anticariensis FP35 = DSM 16096]|uniref:Phage protein n=1 Tax=Litchfieldella anticariensis (strain DSM 16096 / CECT 5854 / CIP 108499 / LMG 22089 / FP35) TaxID=1121939 RepID=S2L450_LITA3|nr:hypothetical protein [Halomonas anticariensis]EPC02494.1 hypothetical protein L861_09085 [Halomonas anticariensis FP35 = DSM 16096]